MFDKWTINVWISHIFTHMLFNNKDHNPQQSKKQWRSEGRIDILSENVLFSRQHIKYSATSKHVSFHSNHMIAETAKTIREKIPHPAKSKQMYLYSLRNFYDIFLPLSTVVMVKHGSKRTKNSYTIIQIWCTLNIPVKRTQ